MPRYLPVQTNSTPGLAGTSNVYFSCGSPAQHANLYAMTIIAWCRSSGSLTTSTIICNEDANNGFTMRGIASTPGAIMTRRRRGGTSALAGTTASGHLVLDKVQCVASVVDDATSYVQTYVGSLTEPLIPVTTTQTTNTGTPLAGDDSALTTKLLNDASGSLYFHGEVYAIGWFARVLTLAEMHAWQFSAFDDPFPAPLRGCRALWYPGYNGTEVVCDYSGYTGGDGIVTGGTLTAVPGISTRSTDYRWARPQYAGGLWRAIDDPQFDDNDYITSVTL